MLGNISCLCCPLLTFFKMNFFEKLFQKISLDPDQDGQSVGPDLGPNCFEGYQQTHASVDQVLQILYFNAFLETFNLNK